MATKKFNLRAFDIANNHISKSSSGIKNMLSKKLKGSLSQDRRIKISEEDTEEDVLSDYDDSNRNFFYGVIFRICPSDTVLDIPDDLFRKRKFSITELNNISSKNKNAHKGHYYFLLNDKFLVTTLPKNITIIRLQRYVNRLLGVEKEPIFEFTPSIAEQKNAKLSELKNIIIKDIHKDTIGESKDSIGKKTINIAKSVLSKLLPPNDIETLSIIEDNQIISAELQIKFSKPQKMSKEDYEKTMGAIIKPISDLDAVVFTTKEGNKITAGDFHKMKTIEIELTEDKKINENQLKQEMEIFLKEVQDDSSN